jgi:hypothetical protein
MLTRIIESTLECYGGRSTALPVSSLHHFSEAYYGQLDLFGEVVRMQRLSNLYESVDALSAKYGKHTVFLGASLPAQIHAQHAGDRGELPERHVNLLPGETPRKRLGIPMFLCEVR